MVEFVRLLEEGLGKRVEDSEGDVLKKFYMGKLRCNGTSD